MPLPSPNLIATADNPSGTRAATPPVTRGFVERRGEAGNRRGPVPGQSSGDRRQFGSSHQGLSEAGRELAQAIDRYKLENHRRYITCDEMLTILEGLGYRRGEA